MPSDAAIYTQADLDHAYDRGRMDALPHVPTYCPECGGEGRIAYGCLCGTWWEDFDAGRHLPHKAADQEDTDDAPNDVPGASSLRSRSGDAVNAETTGLDGGGKQPGIERIMGRVVITSALNLEVPGLTQSQYDRMADAAMDALINGHCLVPADQEDAERKEWRCAPGEHSWQRFPQISDGIVCAKCGADQENTDA